jgi:hypothetical protein
MDPFYLNSAVAYARSYQHGSLIREVASVTGSMYMPSGIGINLLSDVDLRRPMQIRAATDPGISSVMLLGTARVLPMLTVSAGYDAARPIPSATMIGVVPDSLFDRTLRSGLSGGVTVSIQSWTWTLNYSPRTSPTRFGEEYSAMTSVGTYDLLGLGVDVRANGTRNMNSMTQYSTYGFQAHKQLWGVDWRVRGQLNDLLIRQANSSHTSAQGGMDLVVQLAQSLSLSASLDLIRGGGLDMDLLYIECSWRF